MTSAGSPAPTLAETGTLPTGVTFTPNSDGTATLSVSSSAAAGTITFTITASNRVSPPASQTFTLTVG